MKKDKIEKILDEIFPSNWCDDILTGKNSVLGEPPYNCKNIEMLIFTLRQKTRLALIKHGKNFTSTLSGDFKELLVSADSMLSAIAHHHVGIPFSDEDINEMKRISNGIRSFYESPDNFTKR